MKKYFITGTDSGIGKTYICEGLLHAFNRSGLATIGLKPVASGCVLTADGWRNQDACRLQKAANIALPYQQVNPVALPLPVAPHIAAAHVGKRVNRQELIQACQPALSTAADVAIIEGVGGWSVPLNESEMMSDFVVDLNVPVILVVGMRLGCINHALLTYEAICASRVTICGWIANCIDPTMLQVEENISTLLTHIKIPFLGKIAYGTQPRKIIFHLLP